jgi:hypothetical protein
MATSPNFSWPEPDNTDLVKNGALAIRTAVDAIDSSMVDLKGGTTGQVLSKTSNTDMDFTWVAQDDSNAIQNAIVDAKGDIIAASAADTPARLAVGANDTVLTADSSTATGLKWATPAAGMTNPMTTTGDTIYSSSGSTPARLGIGTTGQILTVAGGLPSWATPAAGGSTFSGCRVTKSASQSTSSSADTVLTFDTETFDVDGYHDNSTNNSRITIPTGKTGYFLINGQVSWGANATGVRLMDIYKNGTTRLARNEDGNNGGSYNKVSQASTIVYLSATDYVELRAFQESGGNLNVNSGDSQTYFAISYLGA